VLQWIKKGGDNMSTQTLTLKVRLYPTAEQIDDLSKVALEYQQLCNIVSQWYFDNHFEVNRKRFNHEMYHYLRSISGINSAMVQSVYRTVEARYKTIATLVSQHPYKYCDVNDKKWYSESRTLDWLRKPIYFSRPQADYLRNINYSFVNQAQQLSLNGMHGRIKVAFNNYYADQLINDTTKLGTAKLVCAKKHWFLYIAVTNEIDDWNVDNNQHVVGIDRGLRQIMTIYDECTKTKFFNGKAIAYKRHKFQYLRKQLQAKGTKSAKRHLKQLSQQENRWMSDVNHCLSKTLVDYYGKNTLFVMENLTNVTFERQFGNHQQTQDLHNWAFFDLQNKLTYKATRQSSQVVTVSAQYTSQRCPRCGQICKGNRHHDIHQYQCNYCGFTTNDDRVGAMNLYELGKQYLNGDLKPKFTKTNVTD